MTAEAQRISTRPSGAQPKRKLRNFLLEPRFQLKYTAMVVGVTVAVAAVLGHEAYEYSRGQTQLLNINKMAAEVEKGGDLDEQFVADLEGYARQADRKVLMAILGGILALAVALGLTGIVITHRLVGPAFRLKQLLTTIGAGNLKVDVRLRKGDELQDVFDALREMVERLREEQRQEIAQLEEGLAKAREAGVSDDAMASIREVRDTMRRALD